MCRYTYAGLRRRRQSKSVTPGIIIIIQENKNSHAKYIIIRKKRRFGQDTGQVTLSALFCEMCTREHESTIISRNIRRHGETEKLPKRCLLSGFLHTHYNLSIFSDVTDRVLRLQGWLKIHKSNRLDERVDGGSRRRIWIVDSASHPATLAQIIIIIILWKLIENALVFGWARPRALTSHPERIYYVPMFIHKYLYRVQYSGCWAHKINTNVSSSTTTTPCGYYGCCCVLKNDSWVSSSVSGVLDFFIYLDLCWWDGFEFHYHNNNNNIVYLYPTEPRKLPPGTTTTSTAESHHLLFWLPDRG